MSLMDAAKYGIAALAGVGAIAYGLMGLTDGTVRCDDDVMDPGDTCVVMDDGTSTEYTYEEQAASSSRQDFIFIGGGALFALGGSAFGLSEVRKRRRRDEQSAHW